MKNLLLIDLKIINNKNNLYKNNKKAEDKIKNVRKYIKGDEQVMLKKLAWNTFKSTGNIYTMMELLEVNNMEHEEAKKRDNIQPKQSNVENMMNKNGIK